MKNKILKRIDEGATVETVADELEVSEAIVEDILSHRVVFAGVVNGRHNINDVNEYVYDEIKDVMNFKDMELKATMWVENHFPYGGKLILYVTGLTAAVVSIINACNLYKVSLTLMHYDKDSGCYRPQYLYGDIDDETRNNIKEAIWPYGE